MQRTEMTVTISASAGDAFYLYQITAIPVEEWEMTLVEPKPRCITTQGPVFERCKFKIYLYLDIILKIIIFSNIFRFDFNFISVPPIFN